MMRSRWILGAVIALLAGGLLFLLLPGEGSTGLAGDPEEWSPLDQPDRIRVEVLNGGGRRGMARLATQQLRDRAIDVVYMGNATSFGRDSSVVVDRLGKPEAAEKVAEALGITQVLSEPDSTLFLDVTVLLGSEWGEDDALMGAAGRSVDEGEVPWWDLRRLWR